MQVFRKTRTITNQNHPAVLQILRIKNRNRFSFFQNSGLLSPLDELPVRQRIQRIVKILERKVKNQVDFVEVIYWITMTLNIFFFSWRKIGHFWHEFQNYTWNTMKEDVHKRFKVIIKANTTIETILRDWNTRVKFMTKNSTSLFLLWRISCINSDFCWPDYMVSKLKYGLEYDNTNTSISIWDFLAILAINSILYCPISPI